MGIIEFNFGDKVSGNMVSGNKKLKSDNFNIILNIIAKKLMNEGVDRNGYTPIHSLSFKKNLSAYNVYLDYLITSGYVERDYYEVKNKSFGYRFSDLYKDKMKIYRINLGYGQPKKRNNYTSENNTIIIPDDINERLKSDFKSCKLEYNLKEKQLIKTKDEWGNFIDIGKWFSNNFKMQKWVNGELFYSWKSNRLYTNFNSLSSHVRLNNVRLDNEPIIEFDIHNSFPLMLAKYCIQKNPTITTDYDFQEFCDLVLKGQFYRELQHGLNSIRNCSKQGDEDDWDTRLLTKNETKKLFQVYLNGKSNKIGYINGVQSDIQKYMEYNYSEIDEIVRHIKFSEEKVYYKLVVIETEFILSVISELYEKFENIKILTCHDAIYVPKSFEIPVKEVWNRHMELFTKDIPREDTSIGIDLSEYGLYDADKDDELNCTKALGKKHIPFEWDDDFLSLI